MNWQNGAEVDFYTSVQDQWVRSWGSVSVVGDSDDGAVSVVGDSERSLVVPSRPSAKHGQMEDEWPHICTESRVGDRGHTGVRGAGRPGEETECG